MKGNIPHIAHKVYQNTFLERVGITLKFKEKKSLTFEAYSSFFKDQFGLTLDKDMYEMMMIKHVLVKSTPNAYSYKFSRGYIRLIVEGANYKSFANTILPILNKLVGLIKSLDASINSFEIRKINMWPSEHLTAQSAGQYMSNIFSEELMRNYDLNLSSNDGNESFFTTPILGDGSGSMLLVTMGFIIDPKDIKENRLLLDTEAITQQEALLDVNLLSDTAIKMNDELFDLYHWCVSEEVVKEMSGVKKAEVYDEL